MTEEKIDQSEFNRWLNDRVTKSVFDALREYRTQMDVSILDGNIIMQSQTEAVRLIGRREGIDLVLNISADDVTGEEDEL